MKILLLAVVIIPFCLLSIPTDAQAKRAANDPRRMCREAIQKNLGVSKEAKVSRKAIDRCVEAGGPR